MKCLSSLVPKLSFTSSTILCLFTATGYPLSLQCSIGGTGCWSLDIAVFLSLLPSRSCPVLWHDSVRCVPALACAHPQAAVPSGKACSAMEHLLLIPTVLLSLAGVFCPFLSRGITISAEGLSCAPSWVCWSWLEQQGPAQTFLDSPPRGHSCCQNLAMGTHYGFVWLFFCLREGFSSLYVCEFIPNKCVSAQESGLCRNSEVRANAPIEQPFREIPLGEVFNPTACQHGNRGKKRSESQSHALIPQYAVPLCYKPGGQFQ